MQVCLAFSFILPSYFKKKKQQICCSKPSLPPPLPPPDGIFLFKFWSFQYLGLSW